MGGVSGELLKNMRHGDTWAQHMWTGRDSEVPMMLGRKQAKLCFGGVGGGG